MEQSFLTHKILEHCCLFNASVFSFEFQLTRLKNFDFISKLSNNLKYLFSHSNNKKYTLLKYIIIYIFML